MDAENQSLDEYNLFLNYMAEAKCKVCRRVGEKLFLKGTRCDTPHCSVARKPYAPGTSPKTRRMKKVSEYGRQLREVQKLKNIYGFQATEFANLVEESLKHQGKEDVSRYLLSQLEKGLDNVVYRLGYADSRGQARQLVSHGHVMVNGRRVDLPTITVKVGDEIEIRPIDLDKKYFQNLKVRIKSHQVSSWLKLDKATLKAKVIALPDKEVDNLLTKVSVPLILSYFSH